MTENTSKQLVNANGLLQAIWPDETQRPSLRWLRSKQADGTIPYIKLGAMVWFDIPTVEKAFTRFTVNQKS
ncbi:hypothetical protein N9B94_02215 [Verrucomicrobia bacterium]|nr:hypothetical protein [Verrucomicrobiota bacterium]